MQTKNQSISLVAKTERNSGRNYNAKMSVDSPAVPVTRAIYFCLWSLRYNKGVQSEIVTVSNSEYLPRLRYSHVGLFEGARARNKQDVTSFVR